MDEDLLLGEGEEEEQEAVVRAEGGHQQPEVGAGPEERESPHCGLRQGLPWQGQLLRLVESDAVEHGELHEDPGSLGTGEGNVVEEVRDISFYRNIKWPHEKSLVDEKEEFFESVKEGPLREKTNTFVGHDLPLLLLGILTQSQLLGLKTRHN